MPASEPSEGVPPPPVLNLAPTKKATIDLFARAPQVRKMTRKDKQRIALAAAMGGSGTKKTSSSASPSSSEAVHAARKRGRGDGGATAAAATADDDLFATVFADELAATDAGIGAEDRQREGTRSRQSGRKKLKKQILRHALHKNEEEDARTVFVGNLPNTVDKKHVAKVFKDCGAVESVRIRSQALESGGGGSASTTTSSQPPPPQQRGGDGEGRGRDDEAAAAGQPATGKKDVGRAVRVLRGEVKKDPHYSATAYVLFKDASSVAVAIEKKNGVVFQQRHLVVTALDASSIAYPPETSIFLGNVAYDTTEEDVWAFFAEHGIHDVKRVRLVRDRDSGECKGFGYVEFQAKSSVEPAIATRGALLNGRELRIVHVNKSKDVKAVTASRREKRARAASSSSSSSPPSAAATGARRRREQPSEKRERKDPTAGSAQPSWMGLATNPRRKIPRDLRFLSEGGSDRKPKGPRAPVKRKMRNPEK